jgi:hypothetical protein
MLGQLSISRFFTRSAAALLHLALIAYAAVGQSMLGFGGGTPNTRFPTGESGSSRQVQLALKLSF